MNESKHRYYLEIAKTVGLKSTCLRRKYGAIIVKDDQVIATGYNGSPRAANNCNDVGYCLRNIVGAKKGDSYNLCTSVHAEQNCIISASRKDMIGSTLYIVGVNCEAGFADAYAMPTPCQLCHRMIINAGITKAYGFIGLLDDPGIIGLDISVRAFEEYNNGIFQRTLSEMSLEDQARVLREIKNA